MTNTTKKEQLSALIDFCKDSKKLADANMRTCVGFKSWETRNYYFQMWRYFSKKEKELQAQLESC